MSELLAVNVLLEPDAATKVLAAELNAELRREIAGGPGPAFAFDATHLPHVTLLQRYVRRDDLMSVLETVGAVVQEEVADAEAEGQSLRAGDLVLRAGDLGGGRLGTAPGTEVASVEFEPQPGVRALHESVVRAVAPFAMAGGSRAAFFRMSGEPPANSATVAYVEAFLPEHAGENYAPHLTVGVGREDDVRRLARDHPLRGIRVTPIAVAVAQLGDLGTARKILGRWPLPTAEG
jgi:hypothetical protein